MEQIRRISGRTKTINCKHLLTILLIVKCNVIDDKANPLYHSHSTFSRFIYDQIQANELNQTTFNKKKSRIHKKRGR